MALALGLDSDKKLEEPREDYSLDWNDSWVNRYWMTKKRWLISSGGSSHKE